MEADCRPQWKDLVPGDVKSGTQLGVRWVGVGDDRVDSVVSATEFDDDEDLSVWSATRVQLGRYGECQATEACDGDELSSVHGVLT